MFKQLLIGLLLSVAVSDSYKEPQYKLIKKDGRIEVRQYSEYVIAKLLLLKVKQKKIITCSEL